MEEKQRKKGKKDLFKKCLKIKKKTFKKAKKQKKAKIRQCAPWLGDC